MSPDEVPVADLDPDLHKRAAQLAQKRAQLFVRDIGKLVARNRDALETSCFNAPRDAFGENELAKIARAPRAALHRSKASR